MIPSGPQHLSLRSDNSGFTLIEIMLIGGIIAFAGFGIHIGIFGNLQNMRSLEANERTKELTDVFKTFMWSRLANFAKSNGGVACNAASITAPSSWNGTDQNKFFWYIGATGTSPLGKYGTFQVHRNGNTSGTDAISLATHGKNSGFLDDIKTRCDNSSALLPTTTENSFYFCVVFTKSAETPPKGSIWKDLDGTATGDYAIAEAWYSLRHAENVMSNQIHCNEFGDVTRPGFMGQMYYSIHYIHALQRGASNPKWIHKRRDGTLYLSRPY